jgi:hypothetical protein
MGKVECRKREVISCTDVFTNENNSAVYICQHKKKIIPNKTTKYVDTNVNTTRQSICKFR